MSFNGNKILTTGGGGAILTDDQQLADRAKHLTTTAKTPHPWEFHHDAIGWNYRLPNINAALGVAQLEVLPEMLRAKRELAERYAEVFRDVRGARFLHEPSDSVSNYWLNSLVLESSAEAERDALIKQLNEAGYQCRPLWQPMHELPMYASAPRGDLGPAAVQLGDLALALPDWRGNNRIDPLRTIMRDSRVSLMFMVPAGQSGRRRAFGNVRFSCACGFSSPGRRAAEPTRRSAAQRAGPALRNR